MKYLDGFRAGFDEHMEANGTQVLFMQSDGGLTPASAFSGHKVTHHVLTWLLLLLLHLTQRCRRPYCPGRLEALLAMLKPPTTLPVSNQSLGLIWVEPAQT